MHHFIDIKQCNRAELQRLLATAQQYATQNITSATKPLAGKIIANLFFEASTRTRCSFEIAATKLGAQVLNLDMHSSSVVKGETELDTVLNLQAMGVNGFVIRHKQNGLIDEIATQVKTETVIINAGCGTTQHPSQALLDLLTIQQYFPNWETVKIAIIGDLRHSRVAYSDLVALLTMGVKEICLIAPQELMPTNLPTDSKIKITTDMAQGLAGAQVIMALRLQHERMDGTKIDLDIFHQQYGLTEMQLKMADKNAIVMHPGPMNRGIEITDAVADGAQSVILQQARNGVAARMAILTTCFS